MSDNLLNILSDGNKDIENQKLMDYLSGKLSNAERQEVEQWMAENPFYEEAMDGLQQVGNVNQLQPTVDQLNRQLRKHLQQKKHKRTKAMPGVTRWTYIAVLVVLAIAALVYLVVRKMNS